MSLTRWWLDFTAVQGTGEGILRSKSWTWPRVASSLSLDADTLNRSTSAPQASNDIARGVANGRELGSPGRVGAAAAAARRGDGVIGLTLSISGARRDSVSDASGGAHLST